MVANTHSATRRQAALSTVWFNAWKFQSSEQVWAGLAHCIISQLVDQIDNQLEREKFWLALQAERLDFNKVRQDVHRAIFERFLPKALVAVSLLAFGAVAMALAFGGRCGLAVTGRSVAPLSVR